MAALAGTPEVVAPVSVRNGDTVRARGGGMGGATRRAAALCSLVLLGAAAVLVSQSERPGSGPAALGEEQQAWMKKIRQQSQGMPPEQMFMTAIRSGMMAASDARHEAAVKPVARLEAVSRAPAKTQRLQEVFQRLQDVAPAPAAPVGPPAEVTEGAEGDSLPPQAEVAAEAADAQVPEQVVEGQEKIADEAVPAQDAQAADAQAGVPAGMRIVAGIPVGMRMVAGMQEPNKPPVSVVFQGSPFQVPVQSPGVGIVENAVALPPEAFQGGGWAQETINGMPAPKTVTIEVKKSAAEPPVAEAPVGETPAASEPVSEAPAAAEPAGGEPTAGDINATSSDDVAAAAPVPEAGVPAEIGARSGLFIGAVVLRIGEETVANQHRARHCAAPAAGVALAGDVGINGPVPCRPSHNQWNAERACPDANGRLCFNAGRRCGLRSAEHLPAHKQRARCGRPEVRHGNAVPPHRHRGRRAKIRGGVCLWT